MEINERKKRILEHLTLSGNPNFQSYSQGFKPEASPIRETRPKTLDSRKKAIKEHLARSSANFNCFSLSSPERKQRIAEHVRLSKG